MTQPIMIIAPGDPIDRTWWPKRTHAVYFMPPRPVDLFVFTDETMLREMPVPVRASYRRLIVGGWKIPLPFYVDDRLCKIGGPSLPDGYVMPGFVQGRRMESWPLMHWKLNKAEDRWELWPAGGGVSVATVTREFMDYMGEELTQGYVIQAFRVPLPDEAWRPRPEPEVPLPRRSLRELTLILDDTGTAEEDGS